MLKYKVNDEIYINTDCWTAEEAKIRTCIENESSTKQNVYIVDTRFGQVAIVEQDIYLTHEEASAAYEIKRDKIIYDYCKSIKSLEDLLKFPLDNILTGDDADEEAFEAYKIRARELTGISFD